MAKRTNKHCIRVEFDNGLTNLDVISLIHTINHLTDFNVEWDLIEFSPTLKIKITSNIWDTSEAIQDNFALNLIIYSWCAGRGINCCVIYK